MLFSFTLSDMVKRILLLLLVAGGFFNSFAQYTVTGNAALSSCGQWTVTPDNPNQTGSVYQATSISLNNPFSLAFSVNFGCDNNGGSGMYFVMRSAPWTIGSGGYGMGWQGITGSALGVEFDTYDNGGSIWDVPADHIALMANGSVDHNPANVNNLSGSPLNNISSSSANVEDCQDHLVEITWTPGASQTIVVKVDGVIRINKTSNFISYPFGGNPNVLWGWTGSTSTVSGIDNEQIVGVALEPAFTISPTNCPGQVINFTDASTAQNTITNWSWNFAGLGSSTLQNPSFTFPTAGSYNVDLTITDNTGCSKTETIAVGVGFEVDPQADASPICPGASTVLHANAAPYVGNTCCFDLVLGDLWDDGWAGNNVEVFVNGSSTGTYFPPANGAGGAYYETINLCFDHGDIVDIVINGAAYPGECTYTLYDQSGAVILTVPPGAATWVNGFSQSFTVNCGITPPAYTYVWDNGAYLSSTSIENPTATIPSTTWFHVQVTDPGTGCTITDSVQVSTFPPVTAAISGSQTICQGSSGNLQVNFTGTPPFDVTISGPGGPYVITGIGTLIYNFSASQNGAYTISSVTGSGCTGTSSGSGSITVILPPSVDIAASATYCEGDPIAALTVLSGGGGTVNWYNNPGLTGVPLGTGMSYTPVQGVGSVTYYAATTESVLGCVGPADNVTIVVNPIPPAPTWSGTTTYCEDDLPTPLVGQPSMGGSITWYDNTPPAFVLSTLLTYNPPLTVGTTTYYITETANGCEGPATPISVLVKPTPLAPVVTGDNLYCEGETPTPLTATPSIGGTISWENSLGVNLGTGTSYTPGLSNGFTDIFVFETLNGCQGPSTTYTIEVQPAPTVGVTETISICLGDSVEVTALNNGYDITWSDGQSGETVWLGPDTTTLIYVTATNPLCGFAQDSILIVVNYKPEVIAGNDTLIGIGGEVELWAESDPDVTYFWIPDPLECLTTDCSKIYDVPDQATLYVVIVTDEIGCQNSDSVLVDINGYMEVFVPNIFSPNGDGENDMLVINGPKLYNYYIQIYDRWGKVVFESTEQKEYWDGKLNGSDLAPQTFVYMLSGETVLGDKISKNGNVTIIK